MKVNPDLNHREFWTNPGTIRSFGTWDPGDGDPAVILLVKPMKPEGFEIVGVDPDKGSLPVFSGKYCDTGIQASDLSKKMVQDLAQQVWELRDDWRVRRPGGMKLAEATYFHGLHKIDGLGWYPRQVVQKLLEIVYPEDATIRDDQWELADKILPLGTTEERVLTIASARLATNSIQPLVLPKGTVMLDLDTGENFVDGKQVFTTRPWVYLLGLPLLIATVLCVAVFVVWRRWSMQRRQKANHQIHDLRHPAS